MLNEMKRTKSKWIKWGFFITILILFVLLSLGLFLYNEIMENKTVGFTNTEERVLQETDLIAVDEIVRFHGEEPYHIVFGKDDNNNELLIFVPLLPENDTILEINQSEIMKKDLIEKNWKNDCKNCNLQKIIPAMMDDQPLWELTYFDESNHYVIEYVSMYDGSDYEFLRLRNKYE